MTTTASPFELSATPGVCAKSISMGGRSSRRETPGVAAPVRRTAQMRRMVSPQPWPDTGNGTALLDQPARRRWCALIGPGAVADLLRLATAAARGRSLPRPINLDTLARYGLVASDGERLLVQTTFPDPSIPLLRRLHPALRNDLGDRPPATPAGA